MSPSVVEELAELKIKIRTPNVEVREDIKITDVVPHRQNAR
ncbi:hypothetical protein SM0020_28320 [Sinorhizobium meliloti CCNWSX0020]|uniref:Uncharacterized protein n=1 Tax=Sinorhizobium meliloti CCNWSX0020 TaxID=1107881 RepID=H0G829_RHIML|nr:hypothetical protein SM0020_28320 [Sinorhizobium meliloti CCNWSX0020]